ncbi:NAD(P)-dependent oxidoreductase [Saccharomonospora glauca]|uniref:Beta-hydroxyacid dehydrogenase, 3-hydroxyisobutyrate dehydrogenase n=1 Tax=Saccharomonospora glauca K62 TaxID=928724 RepID=I1D2H8_9PSEU|nr:NAD(P)-binding domain-containing protein [Saccharomonospora glauca]EIE99152.1 beta-hydroxyacid dehydrogenase, 3-hydroxyisobutyrate dehydrogenase [Saccharomonospora glauca K62]
MHERPPLSVTVLGLGTMGTALASALLDTGHAVTVWNRTASRATPLITRGAARAGDVGEALAASRVIVTCLLDHASVHDVLDDHASALTGRTLVNVTNTTPEGSAELASWAASHGADFLDGGIMAVPPQIGTPSAFVLYSGSPSALETARPALEAFGDVRYLGSDPSLAALQDTALLSGMYGLFGGILHAFALVRTGGVTARQFAPVLREWLTGMVGWASSAAERIDDGDHARDVASNLAMQATAYEGFLAVARDRGMNPLLLDPLGRLLRRRVAEGFGHEDITGVIDYLTASTNTTGASA